MKTHEERQGEPLEFQVTGSGEFPRFSLAQRLAITRIAQEALRYIRKQAQAQNIRLSLADDDDNFYLLIADNGRGFDMAEVEQRPVDRGGAGLANLRARAEALNGTLTLTRDTAGEWTEIRVTLPKG
jgi:two-component system NarL family sensor kinase